MTDQVLNGEKEEEIIDITHDNSDEEDEQQTKDQDKVKREAAEAMDKLTDHTEEKQMDENKMKEAFLALRKQEEADKEAHIQREKMLATVKVNKADIEYIANEMEISMQQAERKLRESDGDLIQCLKTLVV